MSHRIITATLATTPTLATLALTAELVSAAGQVGGDQSSPLNQGMK
jgi:hypothetical protein